MFFRCSRKCRWSVGHAECYAVRLFCRPSRIHLMPLSFLLGIGVGAEYPCGSVSASEQSEEPGISRNAQHRWFALATSLFSSPSLSYLPHDHLALSSSKMPWSTSVLSSLHSPRWCCTGCKQSNNPILLPYILKHGSTASARITSVQFGEDHLDWVYSQHSQCSYGVWTCRSPIASNRIAWKMQKFHTPSSFVVTVSGSWGCQLLGMHAWSRCFGFFFFQFYNLHAGSSMISSRMLIIDNSPFHSSHPSNSYPVSCFHFYAAS